MPPYSDDDEPQQRAPAQRYNMDFGPIEPDPKRDRLANIDNAMTSIQLALRLTRDRDQAVDLVTALKFLVEARFGRATKIR